MDTFNRRRFTKQVQPVLPCMWGGRSSSSGPAYSKALDFEASNLAATLAARAKTIYGGETPSRQAQFSGYKRFSMTSAPRDAQGERR